MNLFTNRLRSSLDGSISQRYWLIASLLFVILGERLTRLAKPVDSFPWLAQIADNLNKNLYLGLERPFNALTGIVFILGGAILFAKLAKQPTRTESNDAVVINNEPRFSMGKQSLAWLAASLIVYLFVISQLAKHQSSSFLVFSWLGSLLIPSLLLWKLDRKNKINLNPLISYRDGIWLIALFAFAVGVGCFLLNDLPAGWIPDEGPFWATARKIALGALDPPFFDFGVFTFPIASSLVQGWIMSWAGVDMWGWRFASVLPAALTVFPMYLMARDLFDRRVAIAAIIVMVVNPYFLSFARLGYNNSQSLLPVTACLYFLAHGLRNNSRFYLWLAGLTAGFGFYTYFAAWLGLTAIVIVLVALPLVSKEKYRALFPRAALLLTAALAVILPRIVYAASGDDPVSLHYKIWETGALSAFYGNYVFGSERVNEARIIKITEQANVYYDPELYGIILVRGIVRSAAGLFDTLGYKEHSMVHGMAGPISSVFFALGLAFALAHWMKFRFAILSIWFAAGFIFLDVLSSLPPRPTHFVAAIPVMALLSALGLITFLDLLLKTKSQRAQTLALVSLTTLIVCAGLFQYFFMVPFTYPPSRDDYISWISRQIAEPANVYLVDHYAINRNPRDEVLLGMTPHHVVALTSAQIEADPGQLADWKNFVAVLGTNRTFADQLASQIPGATVHTAFASLRTFRGYVVTDLPVNATMDANLWHGIKDLLTSPARWILAPCVIGMIVFSVMEHKKSSLLLHSKIARRNQDETAQ
ncbi:MAG: glycosyltransferase family 39 protein [Anaerolineales bacterium]|nr:glycosyltransferase family 39 protein [Anaerolineales bacterium]